MPAVGLVDPVGAKMGESSSCQFSLTNNIFKWSYFVIPDFISLTEATP